MNVVYFQPKGMNPKYCEVGMILKSDPEYISYLNEPCKIRLDEVKVIPKEQVYFDKKQREYIVRNFLKQ